MTKAIAYSNTRLTTFKRCRLKYHWQYVEKQESKKSHALRRGSAAHAALAHYYAGNPTREAIAKAWLEYDPLTPQELEKVLELDFLLARYMRWALANDGWKVQAIEETVEVQYGSHTLMGIWDLLVKKNGSLFIVDHKFQKSHSFSHLEVDSQVTHYLALAKLMGIPVKGLIYNIVNLELGDTQTIALRQIASRSDVAIQNYLDGLDPQIKEIKKAERKKLPLYANWTKDCCWDCQFYRRCVDDPHKILLS